MVIWYPVTLRIVASGIGRYIIVAKQLAPSEKKKGKEKYRNYERFTMTDARYIL